MVGHIMPKSEHVKTCNETTQTIIRCYPHIPKENQLTKVYSNHGCQTAITISPKLANINIYPSLEFIPYERITENSIREIDLPRKAFLHWRLPSTLDDSSHHLFSHSFNRTLTSIDDGDAFHQKGVLKKSSTLSILGGHKFLSTYHHRYQRIMKTKAAQTTLNVSPHVLDADEVATVYIERCVQTSVTCTPNASISSIVPRLEEYLTHNEAPNPSTEYLEFELFRSQSSTETLLRRKPNKMSERVNPSTESMNIYERFSKKYIDEIDESQIPDIVPNSEKTADPSTPSNNFEYIPSHFDSKSTYENPPAVGGNLFSNAKSDIPKTSTNDNELRTVASDGNAPETSASAISSQKAACSRKCLCGNRKLNNIAHKLRVQASTLKLTQKVFPPGVQFEDRIIEVLNTTVAIFQTEMANILEVYVDDDDKTESCLTCYQETEEKDEQSCLIKQEDFGLISTVEEEPLATSEFMDQDLESFESYCKLLKNERMPTVDSARSEEAEVFYDLAVVLQPPSEARQDQPTLSRPAEPFGDFLENRHSDNIACECHPTAAGAAPSLLNIDTPTTSTRENVMLPPTIPNSAEQQPLLDNAAMPSWALEDSSSAENNLKFEVLLKNTIKDVESCSAASAIVIRATISCPNTKKTIKAKIKTAASLPDLSEQVIRLSVLYKSKSTESEKLVEEICFPAQVQIQMPSDGSHLEAFESELLIRCTSCECNDSFSTIGKKQSTNKSALGLPSKGRAISKIPSSHTKVENVRFSSMTCPIHPDKASCPPGPTIRTSVPQTQKQPCAQPSSKGNIEITVSCHLSLDSYKNNENDEKFSLMYEHEEEYDEPYISMLYDEGSSTGVQTDIALGEKLESTSLNSLNPDQEIEENIVDDVCDSRTEIPWQTISLPAPGSYIIKKQEKVPYVPYVPSDTTEEVDEIEPPESNVEVTIEGVIETSDDEFASEPDEETVPEAEEVAEEPDEIPSEPEDIELEPENVEPEPEEDIEPLDEEGGEEKEEGEEVQGESEEKMEDEENEDEEEEDETEKFEEAGDVFIEPSESVVSKKSEKLIFQIDHQINEPYMEGLFKRFPDAVIDKDSCTSHTEMPWKDIVLPEHCTIRKIFKPVEFQETESVEETVKMCSCRGRADSALPPAPAGEDDVIQLHVGFDEPPSTLMPVNNQTASVGPSEYSDVHELAKRVAKDYTFSISTSKDASSSVIVNIKPSTDCQFPSQKIAVCDDKYNTGKSLTTTQSDSEVGGEVQTEMPEIGTRCSTSLPQMKPNKTARATISVKRLGLPDQTIIQRKQLTPGENIMTIQIPDEPIKINVKFSAPPLPPKDPPPELTCVSSEPEVPEETEDDIVNEEENLEEQGEENAAEEQEEENAEEEQQEEQPEAEPEETENDEPKVEETEPVKEEPEMNPFKRDPIGSVLKAYETEMKPLRQALAQLQEKILSLNIPEIQAFMCPAVVVPPPTVRRPSVSNRYPESGRPRTCPGRSKHQVPPRLSFNPQVDSSYNNNYSTRSPGEHCTPYPNSHYPFMAPNPASSISSPYHRGRDSMYDEPSYMESTHSSKSRQRKLDRNTFRMQENPYPQRDLAWQARNYGMYPDYRGRAYPDERVAYQNSHEEYSFEDDPPEKSHSKKLKIRHVISIHSREKMVDRDCGSTEHPSERSKPKTSDKSTNKCRDNSAKRRRSSRKSSQTGKDLEECCIARKLRPGQALKTSPDEFLPQVKRHKTESVGTCTSSRIKITIPLE